MNSYWILQNVLAYSLQIGMLIGVAGFLPSLFRLRQPGARLAYWHVLLAACLVLPLIRPWRQEVIAASVQVSTVITAVRPVHVSGTHRFLPVISKSDWALLAVACGVFVRLAWLAIGFLRLRRYRRHAEPLQPAPSWAVEAALCISDHVTSPVTFGWRKPVVLLPAGFPELERSAQEAILCHEILHVRRSDWLVMIGEEVVRSVFWFHPAVWWLLGEIGLAREQEVDRQAIEITREREEYMDALLAIAGTHHQLDLAPAPLFLRKRHLKQRVVQILKENQMSKTRLISAMSASVALLAATCWLVTATFPLEAQPQMVADAPGVTVDLRGAELMHRSAVIYPMAALQQRIQGTVSVEVKLDQRGNVADVRVLSGPDELRRTAIEAVLQWHFTRTGSGSSRVIDIAFELPKNLETATSPGIVVSAGAPGVVGGVRGGVVGGVQQGVIGGVVGGVPVTYLPAPPLPSAVRAPSQSMEVRGGVLGGIIGSVPVPSGPRTVTSIGVIGLPESARNELLSSLPVRTGDVLTPELMQNLQQAVRGYDEHLVIRQNPGAALNDVQIQIVAPGAQAQFAPSSAQRVKVGGNVQAVQIIKKVVPMYPALAKSARVSGVVTMAVLIARDGTVAELHVISGVALLQQAAVDAVKQWVYRPTYLNGEPVEVETTVDVNFTLQEVQ